MDRRLRFILIATDNNHGTTVYYSGTHGWHPNRKHAKQYRASDAAMMKIAMHDSPNKFAAGDMREIAVLPA